MNDLTVNHPFAKIISVWGVIGITSWADAAAFVAFLYSSVLLVEWFYKRFVKKRSAKRDAMDSDKAPL